MKIQIQREWGRVWMMGLMAGLSASFVWGATLGCAEDGAIVGMSRGSTVGASSTSSSSTSSTSSARGTTVTDGTGEYGETASADAEFSESARPELWVFGSPGAPELARQLNAKGLRAIIDLRTLKMTQARQIMNKIGDLDIGLVLTVRWAGGEGSTDIRGRSSKKVDTPPTPEEAQRAMDGIIELVNMPAAKKISDKLWIQFFNEASGGPGQFMPEHEDAMFDFATTLAERLRAEAPHVKICGPGLTAMTVLDLTDESSLNRLQKLRIHRLRRSIEWSIEHGDAVDIHLHAEDGEWARRELATLQRVLHEYPGGEDTHIISLEWSCARYKQRNNRNGVKRAIFDIWKAMRDYNVRLAAYGAVWPGTAQKEMYQWKSLLTVDGQPNEPFNSVFKSIAAGQDTVDGGNDDDQ